jgi:cell division transport system permease protein
MKHIGATTGYIRGAFLKTGLAIGAISGLTAGILLFILSWYLAERFPMLDVLKSTRELLWLSGGMVLAGILVSLFSTLLAVNRYMKESD